MTGLLRGGRLSLREWAPHSCLPSPEPVGDPCKGTRTQERTPKNMWKAKDRNRVRQLKTIAEDILGIPGRGAAGPAMTKGNGALHSKGRYQQLEGWVNAPQSNNPKSRRTACVDERLDG